MTKITGLNEMLAMIPGDKSEKPVTLKTVILNSIAVYRTPQGTEAPIVKLKVTKLGMCFLGAGNVIDLDDDYITILDRVVSAPSGYPDFIAGQAILKIQEARDKRPKG
ncbi:hypothetical protein LCGC14_0901040 [marine sediment metagenome]|uniref:Uncharacterized protein n=1 Tax=marine sediment metagenome TaxID=412755 RepID=A0A0F9NWF4_9ZZZZ